MDNAEQLEKLVLVALPVDRRPTEEEVLAKATDFRTLYPVSDDVFAGVIKWLHARLAITMDLGTALVELQHVPWLAARKAEIEPFFWNRYEEWLHRRRWSAAVTKTLDRVADEILDLSGDPKQPGQWRRRGLVVGDVQSGKTATYTALACKAGDAGYRLIILLTGTLESLRRQTQERLDEGFVGLDSSEMLQFPLVKSRVIGVGIVDPSHSANVFTSRQKDFSRQLMTQLGFQLDNMTQPVLVVIKKNKSILQNLEAWLRGYNAGADGKISAPLLVIDDEADLASINTKANDQDPTAINQGVRALLSLFHRYTYVGVTATPFANVFIDPDSDSEMLGDDLFPENFIYSLEAPTNYVGPQSLFSGASIDDPPPQIRWNDDAEPFFPRGHKSSQQVRSLPESLYDAIRTFLVSTTLRDLRGEGATHRSMLVNVSPFTNVQNQVADLVDTFVRDLQREVRLYAKLPPYEALRIQGIADLERCWRDLRGPDDPDWPAVQAALNASIAPVLVKPVNQLTGAASLDYKAYKDVGLRVIAVGGNSLSRGLTLEGLSSSYFYRNSQMYDTLLQMGRWFGYRDGFADLCRLWLSEEAFNWYVHIAGASEELRLEFKRMQALGLTPRDFGLKVRSHPESLIVTARNKMRSAQTVIRQISLSAEGIETARLRTNPKVIQVNSEASDRFLRSLGTPAIVPTTGSGPTIWNKVSAASIAAYLESFETHPLNYDFQAERLASYLRRTTQECLQLWDVSVPSGTLPPQEFGGIQVRPYRRHVVINRGNGSMLVSGSGARVGSRGDEKAGLTEEQIAKSESGNSGKNTGDKAYREVRTRPLLLVHVFRGFTRPAKGEKATIPFEPDLPPLVGIGLSFPRFDDSDVRERVEYKVNLVEWRSLFDQEIEDDPVDYDDFD